MSRLMLGLVTTLAALSCVAPSPLGARDTPATSLEFTQKLNTKVPQFETAGRTAVACILELAYRYELPTGIEYVDKAAMTQRIELQFRNESVRQILTAIVHELPEYQLNFSDGLVDIFEARQRQNPNNLLNTVIGVFDVADSDAAVANFELTTALGHQIHPGGVSVGSIAKGQLGKKKVTLHLRNRKVYEIINAIVAQNGKAAWTVIVPGARLTGTDVSDLWHLYPLEAPFSKDDILDGLSTLKL